MSKGAPHVTPNAMSYDPSGRPSGSGGPPPAGGFGAPPPAGGYGAPNAYPYAFPGPPPPPKSGTSTGALVAIIVVAVGGVLVAVSGILAVLGIYGTRKYIVNAKTAEARHAVGMIAKGAAMAYESESMAPAVLTEGAATSIVRKLCPSAQPVPASLDAVAAKKYQSSVGDWEGDEGWRCLRFEMPMPQYYQYRYTSTATTFRAVAHGDLNGDGVASTFEVQGKIEGGRLVTAPKIEETNPEE